MADKTDEVAPIKESTEEVNQFTPIPDPRTTQDVSLCIQSLLQSMQDKFESMSEQIITRLDEMGNRVDDLEKNITDLMTQAGIESEK